MNIKIEQKKEYLKPQMTVLEFEHEDDYHCQLRWWS